jgi:hypothetical protein
MLTLTPAFDITPQVRSGGEAAQAMAIVVDGWRMSQVAGCIERGATYLLDREDALGIVEKQIALIEEGSDEVAQSAGMSAIERKQAWNRQILNPYALAGSTRSRYCFCKCPLRNSFVDSRERPRVSVSDDQLTAFSRVLRAQSGDFAQALQIAPALCEERRSTNRAQIAPRARGQNAAPEGESANAREEPGHPGSPKHTSAWLGR